MGTIQQPTLYEAVLRAALPRAEVGNLPDRVLLPREVYLYRSTLPEYLPAASSVADRTTFVSLSAVEECLRVRDQSTDKNRFTGCAANGKPGPSGGVYFSLNQAAGLAEMMHYAEKDMVAALATNDYDKMLPMDVASRRVSIPYLLAQRAILVARPTVPLKVADVSLHNQSRMGEVRRFLNEIGKDPQVSKLLVGRTLPDLMLDETDYSVARAIGHAIQSSRFYDGMLAETARATERSGERGSNMILFGKQNAVVTGLDVVRVLYFFAPGVVAGESIIRATVEHRF